MADKLNNKFLNNPLVFVGQHTVDINLFDKSPDGNYKKNKTNSDFSSWMMTSSSPALLLGRLGTVAFDFHPRPSRIKGIDTKGIVIRLAKSAFPYSIRRQNTKYEKFFLDIKCPVEGYYFPYVLPAKLIKDPEELGYIDFPKKNPLFKFIFTGSMQGCAIVITDSPMGDTHLRAYHYPSPETNNYLLKAANWLPRKMLGWFGSERYTVPGTPNESDAFNFLYYDQKWHIVSQPLKRHNFPAISIKDSYNDCLVRTQSNRVLITQPLNQLPKLPPAYKKPKRRHTL